MDTTSIRSLVGAYGFSEWTGALDGSMPINCGLQNKPQRASKAVRNKRKAQRAARKRNR